MLSKIFKNDYMRLDEKAVTMAQPQKMWSGIGNVFQPFSPDKHGWLVGWFLVHQINISAIWTNWNSDPEKLVSIADRP